MKRIQPYCHKSGSKLHLTDDDKRSGTVQCPVCERYVKLRKSVYGTLSSTLARHKPNSNFEAR